MKLSIIDKHRRTRWKLRRVLIHFSQELVQIFSKDVTEAAVSYTEFLTETDKMFSFEIGS